MDRGDSLVSAASVFWGEYVDPYSIANSLISGDNPERQTIVKDSLNRLSVEAKQTIAVVLNAPDEFFMKNGKIRTSFLDMTIRRIAGYKAIKTVKQEIRKLIGNL